MLIANLKLFRTINKLHFVRSPRNNKLSTLPWFSAWQKLQSSIPAIPLSFGGIIQAEASSTVVFKGSNTSESGAEVNMKGIGRLTELSSGTK